MIIFNRTVSQWIGKTIRYASWTGEIDGRETDMPGTLGNKCELKQCKYKKNDGYLPWNANFGEASDIIGVTQQSGSRPDEWGIWVDTGGMTMKIWDVNPLQ